MGYWEGTDYLGFGVSASSLFDGNRYTHIRSLSDYIDFSDGEKTAEDYISSAKITENEGESDEKYEYIMLSLRLSDGIELTRANELFGFDFYLHFKDIIDRTVKAGLATLDGGRYFLTDRGMCVSSSVICEFLLRMS